MRIFTANLTEYDQLYVYDKLHDFRDICNLIKRVMVVTRFIAFIIHFPTANIVMYLTSIYGHEIAH
jgi:hypothetical protein